MMKFRKKVEKYEGMEMKMEVAKKYSLRRISFYPSQCILFRVVLLSSLSHSLSFSFSLFLSLSLFFVRLSAESKFFCRPFSMSALICTLHTLKLM